MVKVKIGGREYKLAASPITLYLYKKEFKKDMLGDLMAFDGLDKDASKFDGIAILQMAWAMIKTAKAGQLINFEQWLEELDYVDFEDSDMALNILDEARKEFFRGGEQTPGQSNE